MRDLGHFKSRRCRWVLGCAIAALNAPVAFAQTPASTSDGSSRASDVKVEEIIVTAQKRSDRLIDVPISVAAVTGDQLTQLGITSSDELERIVPGFTYKPARTGPPVYSIRGIGFDDTGIGSAPAVSVSVDQVPLPFLIMTPAAAMDIERVEVLKGPQGTLFGQNTTGGAINFIAAKPTEDLHSGFDVTYGRFDQIDGNGYISGPISDTLRFRIAALHENRDGWQISESRPNDRLGARDFSAGRLLLDWAPTDRLSVELNVNGWVDHSETQAAQYIAWGPTIPIPPGSTNSRDLVGDRAPTPDKARLADWLPGQSFRRDNKQYQFSARADWTANEQVTLTSISAYSKLESDVPTDTSGTDLHMFDIDQIGDIETFSQELRAAIDVAAVKLTIGGNFEHDRTDDFYGVYYIANNNQIGPFSWNTFVQDANQKTDTYAGFASADIPLTATLTAQAGVRYTKQKRDFEGCLRDGGDGNLASAIALVPTLAGLPYSPAAPGECVSLNADFTRPDVITDKLDEDNVSWRVGLNWKPDTDTLVYANVTRGFKSGNFSPVPAVFVAQFRPVTQEEVTAYEVGMKASLLERRMDVSAALFYDDYKDKQLLGYESFPPFGALPTLQNIPKSTVKGAELNVSARPIRGLTLAAGGTYVRTRISESFTVSDVLGGLLDIKGDPFPNAPRWQGNASGTYEFPLSSNLTASFGGDVSYRSSSQSSFGDRATFRVDSYALLGLRAGIGAADDRWRVEVWGKNVTDKFYVNSIFKAGDTITRTVGLPATYGVTLRTRF